MDRLHTRRLLFPAVVIFFVILCTAQPAQGQIYWIDDDQIWKSDVDGSNRDVLIADTDKPRGLTVDLENDNIFWTDDWNFDGQILRASLDGTGKEVLFEQGTPRGIALDVPNGKVYWADLRNDGALMRANLDGSDAETLVAGETDGETDGILDVALDHSADKAYWTTRGAIMRADLDGTNVEVFADITDHVQPTSVAVDPAGGYVYWVDTTQDEIRRMATVGGGDEETVVRADEPAGVAIDNDSNTLYWLNSFLFSGGGGNIMRSALDGSDPEMILGDMVFPEGPLVVAGGETGTAVEAPPVEANSFSLVDVYPNPYRDAAKVIVSVERAVHVQMELIDVRGRRIAQADHGVLSPGRHTLRVTEDTPSGVYFVRVSGASAVATKMLLRVR